MDSLSDRQQKVLFCVIDEFIASGEPVSSAAVVDSGVVDVSSATVRNDMARLEDLGLLIQPHTSAGRIPSPEGTRRYVNYLFQRNKSLESPFDDAIQRELDARGGDVEHMVRKAGELVSHFSNLTSIVSVSSVARVSLREIKLSLLSGEKVLAILIAEDGRVFNRVVRLDDTFEADQLTRAQNYLSELVAGRTLEEVRRRVEAEQRQARSLYRDYVRHALEIGRQALEVRDEREVHVEGQFHMLEFEELSADMERLRQLLYMLEEKDRVRDLLERIYDSPDVSALIGPELGWEVGDNLSLVFAGYSRGAHRMGVIGVLGPIRMDYARLIPLVDRTAQLLSEGLGEDA
jgi:heat-inducible transcriptional repressor